MPHRIAATSQRHFTLHLIRHGSRRATFPSRGRLSLRDFQALPPRTPNSPLSRKLQPFPRTQKVPRRASSAGDFTSDSALIQLKALKAVFTWPWGRQPRYRRAYWGTSWRSSPGTWRPACWPARRKQPYPPTCRGHPASRRARRGSWWDNPR